MHPLTSHLHHVTLLSKMELPARFDTSLEKMFVGVCGSRCNSHKLCVISLLLNSFHQLIGNLSVTLDTQGTSPLDGRHVVATSPPFFFTCSPHASSYSST